MPPGLRRIDGSRGRRHHHSMDRPGHIGRGMDGRGMDGRGMDGLDIDFCGCRLRALGSGALFWPDAQTLVVGDLHLGRAARGALRRGSALLPPYEGRDTLARLGTDLAATRAKRVICLGDSFDDARLPPDAETALSLTRLAEGRDWVWIAGNHDPRLPEPEPDAAAPCPAVPGRIAPELGLSPLILRHIPAAGAKGEVSAHLHPKITLQLGRERLRRPCFLLGRDRLMLPAYGSYTGGLDCSDPAFAALFGPGTRALILPPSGSGAPLVFPFSPRSSGQQRSRSSA